MEPVDPPALPGSAGVHGPIARAQTAWLREGAKGTWGTSSIHQG